MTTSHSQAPFPESVALVNRPIEPCYGLSCPHRIATSASPQSSHPSNRSLSRDQDEADIKLISYNVHTFLARELNTPLLDELYPRLWLVARRSGANIDSLHEQVIKGRQILPAEDPNLHLVWRGKRIFVKPLPDSLLNYEFWAEHLPPSTAELASGSQLLRRRETIAPFDRKVAMGFLRSYAFLIQHRLDFILACENHLMPNNVDWMKWCNFIAHFRVMEDHEVANRYRYGQLRLSRLDWAVRLFGPRHATSRWFYQLPLWSIGSYVEWAIAPFVFTFASLSLVLSSMQVIVSISVEVPGTQALRYVCWVFSVIVLILSATIWILLFVVPLSILMWQLSWGYKNRANRGPQDVAERL